MDKNKQAVYVFNKLADLYQAKFMDVSLYAESFDLFCDLLKTAKPSVLEIACGPGNITRYLLDKRPDLQILGTDLSENMVVLARKNNPDAEFEVMDCRAIASIRKKFDGLMCGFCLPYLSREEVAQLIADAYLILNPGGLIYLSTMEDDYENSAWKKASTGDETFQHFYREQDLAVMLAKSGFEILNVQRKEYTSGETAVTDLAMIAEKPANKI